MLMVDSTEDLQIWTLHKYQEGQRNVYKCSASRSRQNHLHNDPSVKCNTDGSLYLCCHSYYISLTSHSTSHFLYLLYLHLSYFKVCLLFLSFLRNTLTYDIHFYVFTTFTIVKSERSSTFQNTWSFNSWFLCGLMMAL
jgi:hypothetical protein